MGRIISFLLAIALFFCGAGLFVYCVLFVSGWNVWMLLASGGMAALGGVWFWSSITAKYTLDGD